jgi:hypothetical protein
LTVVKGFIEIRHFFNDFAWTKINKMKPKGNWCSKGPVFSICPTHHPFWTNFEWKCTEIWPAIDDILQKVSRVYVLVQNPTLVYRMPQNETILNKMVCPISDWKIAWKNSINGIAQFSHTCNTKNYRYLETNLVVIEVNQ